MPPNSNRIEQSVYEDFARMIVGPEAYLVFVFDRLISAVSPLIFIIRAIIDVEITSVVQQPGGVHSELISIQTRVG